MTVVSAVRAAGPLGARGQPIQTSSYSIDMFQGPVLASGRVTGLAGAYAGIGEGVEGDTVNAASPAMRVPWSVDWFDYDLSAGLTFPSALRNTDFDNNGTSGFSYNRFVFATLGANLQLGDWGFGVTADGQTYRLKGFADLPGNPIDLSVTLARGHLLLSRSFVGGQLMIGAGARFATLDFTASGYADPNAGSRTLFSMFGAGPEAGVIWAPHALPVRLGVSARAPVRSRANTASETQSSADGDTLIGTMYLPTEAELPWEIEVGVGFQFGKRSLNVPWINPHAVLASFEEEVDRARQERKTLSVPPVQERYYRSMEDDRLRASRKDVRARLKARDQELPRERVLVSASLLVSGPVSDAVGVESFFQQRVDRSGKRPTVTPRLGIETEPFWHWLKVRAGTYLEPTRFAEGRARIHAAGGFDVKLFRWSVLGLFDDDTHWRAGGCVDGARDYFGWGVGIGVWH